MAISYPEYPIEPPEPLDNVVYLDKWQQRRYDPYGQPGMAAPEEEAAPHEKVVLSPAAYAQLQWVSEQNLPVSMRLASRMGGSAQQVIDRLAPTALRDVFGRSLQSYLETDHTLYAVSDEARARIESGNIGGFPDLLLTPNQMQMLLLMAGPTDEENSKIDIIAEHVALTAEPVTDEDALVREHGIRSQFGPLVTKRHLRSIETFPE